MAVKSKRGRHPLKLAGQKFGRLTVRKMTGERWYGGHVVWSCSCACGNKDYRVTAAQLNRSTKPARSCGCVGEELRKKTERKSKFIQYAKKHPKATYGDIARKFDVSHQRISQVFAKLKGVKR